MVAAAAARKESKASPINAKRRITMICALEEAGTRGNEEETRGNEEDEEKMRGVVAEAKGRKRASERTEKKVEVGPAVAMAGRRREVSYLFFLFAI